MPLLGGASTLKKANTREVLAKARWGAEQDGSKAKLLSCLNIQREVVDKRDFGWVQLMLPHEKTKELRVGFDEANSAGDEDAGKPV